MNTQRYATWRHRPSTARDLTALAITLLLIILTACSTTTGPTAAHPPVAAATTGGTAQKSSRTPLAAPQPPTPPQADRSPTPVSLSIPAINVTTRLQPLGLNTDGSLQSPTEWQRAGWYDHGVRPGEPGPAVIIGHVDSVNGPAVFFDLRELTPGDTAVVTRSDGSSITFVIDTIQEFPKRTFPTQAVYGDTAGPVLRLITCTGDFDAAARSYVDNLVVSAHLKSSLNFG